MEENQSEVKSNAMLNAFIFLIKYGWTVLFLINVILPIKDINLYEASLSD